MQHRNVDGYVTITMEEESSIRIHLRSLQRQGPEDNGGEGTAEDVILVLLLCVLLAVFVICRLPDKYNPCFACLPRRQQEESSVSDSMHGIEAVLETRNQQEQKRRIAIQHSLRLELFQPKRQEESLQKQSQTISQHDNKSSTHSTTHEESLSSEADGVICAICLETFGTTHPIASVRNERCRHSFHPDCITEWLLKHDECPCCRCRIVEDATTINVESSCPNDDDDNDNDSDRILQDGLQTFARLHRQVGHRHLGVSSNFVVSVMSTETHLEPSAG